MNDKVYEVTIEINNNNLYLLTSISTNVINLEHVAHIESSFSHNGDERMIFHLRDSPKFYIDLCDDGSTSSMIVSEYERWKREQGMMNWFIKLLNANPLLSKEELLKKYEMISELSQEVINSEEE